MLKASERVDFIIRGKYASNPCLSKENLSSKEERSESCACMCVVWQKTLSKNVLKPAQECPAQQLKSSSPQSSEARSPVTLPASKWNAVHSSLISHTGSLTSWPPHSSVGFRGFEIICAAFLLQDPRCLCDQHDKTHRKELGRVVSPHPVTPFFFIFLSFFSFLFLNYTGSLLSELRAFWGKPQIALLLLTLLLSSF